MSTKSPNPNQPRLFIIPPEGSIEDWQYPEGSDAYKVHSVMSGEIGPHTNVAERAERLIGIMNKLAHRNKLGGFDVGVHDKKYSDPIWMHYLERTPFVIKHAIPKQERLHAEAMNEFWITTDFESLRGRGRVLGLGRQQVRSRFEKMWSDFNHDIGHHKAHADLVKLRRTQEKFLPIDHPLREENRLEKYKKKVNKNQEEAA